MDSSADANGGGMFLNLSVEAAIRIGVLALIGEDNPDRPGSEIVKAYIQLDPDFRFVVAAAKNMFDPHCWLAIDRVE